MENNKTEIIELGLKTLIEERLKSLEKIMEIAAQDGGEIHKEVDFYFDAERVARQMNIDIIEYRKTYHNLIDQFWKKKIKTERKISEEYKNEE